jgi:hypothetical protein
MSPRGARGKGARKSQRVPAMEATWAPMAAHRRRTSQESCTGASDRTLGR